jgi:hypothetical protein
MCRICNEILHKDSFTDQEVKQYLEKLSKLKHGNYDSIIDKLLGITEVVADKEIEAMWEAERE